MRRNAISYVIITFNGIAINFICVDIGNSFSGYSGDGSLATNAKLNSPGGIAVGSTGNIYIADTANNAIRSVLQILGAICHPPLIFLVYRTTHNQICVYNYRLLKCICLI